MFFLPLLQAFAQAGSLAWPAFLFHLFFKLPISWYSPPHTPTALVPPSYLLLPHWSVHPSNPLALEVCGSALLPDSESKGINESISSLHLGLTKARTIHNCEFLGCEGKILTSSLEKQGISLPCSNSFPISLRPGNLGAHRNAQLAGLRASHRFSRVPQDRADCNSVCGSPMFATMSSPS